jgi:hypothetical protein
MPLLFLCLCLLFSSFSQWSLAKPQIYLLKQEVEQTRDLVEQLPGAQTSLPKPLEGTIEADKLTIEPSIMASKALEESAEKILRQIKKRNPQLKTLYVSNDIEEFRNYIKLKENFDSNNNALKELINKLNAPQSLWVASAMVIVPAALITAVSLATYFRENNKYTGLEVKLEQEDLNVILLEKSMSGNIKDLKIKIVGLEPSTLKKFSENEDEKELPSQIQETVIQLEEKIKTTKDETLKAEYKKALKTLLDGEKNYFALLEKIQDSGYLQSLEPDSGLLLIKLRKAGGTTKATQKFLSNNLSFAGGVVVNYLLYDNNLKLLDAEHFTDYSGFAGTVSLKTPTQK